MGISGAAVAEAPDSLFGWNVSLGWQIVAVGPKGTVSRSLRVRLFIGLVVAGVPDALDILAQQNAMSEARF